MDGDLKDIRIGNVIDFYNDGWYVHQVVSEQELADLLNMGWGPPQDVYFEPIILTKEILRDNLGFTVSDMGDFWQCEKGDFILIQAKLPSGLKKEMPFTFGYKTTIAKTRSFTAVHKLQNFYYEIQEQELQWNKK